VAAVYLMNSHRELYRRFVTDAVLDGGVHAAETRAGAEVLAYIAPPWPDPDAPMPLRSLSVRDLHRVFVFSQDDVPFPWARGMYASLSSSRARAGYVGGFYIPPGDPMVDELDGLPNGDPDLLWSFVGTVSNAPVRAALAQLSDPDALVTDTQRFSDVLRHRSRDDADRRDAQAGYAASLGRSSFVVCPRGRGLSSMRIFEAMQVGRCPVIVSDGWLEPPFADWSACSIRIAESDVKSLPEILRARRDEASILGEAARRIWEDLFSPRRRLNTLLRSAALSGRRASTAAVDFAAAVLHEQTARALYRRIRRSAEPRG
jgi:hypothetical protein